VNPTDLVPYNSQIVELRFHDGERILAHIVSIDPDVAENHVFYLVLDILQPGPPRARVVPIGAGCACSAQDIGEVLPTDGIRHGPRVKKPWWRFW
jgi:hypothetical protein